MEMCALEFLSGVGKVHLRATYVIREEECVPQQLHNSFMEKWSCRRSVDGPRPR